MTEDEILKAAMTILAKRTSEKKAAASRANGAKGGRPKKVKTEEAKQEDTSRTA